MAQIGFCGLGQMGAVMAGRLLDGGLDVGVWNRTQGRTDELAERNARAATTAAQTFGEAEAAGIGDLDYSALVAHVRGHLAGG